MKRDQEFVVLDVKGHAVDLDDIEQWVLVKTKASFIEAWDALDNDLLFPGHGIDLSDLKDMSEKYGMGIFVARKGVETLGRVTITNG